MNGAALDEGLQGIERLAGSTLQHLAQDGIPRRIHPVGFRLAVPVEVFHDGPRIVNLMSIDAVSVIPFPKF